MSILDEHLGLFEHLGTVPRRSSKAFIEHLGESTMISVYWSQGAHEDMLPRKLSTLGGVMLEIAGGIILAVLVLTFWPYILAIGVAVLGIAVLAALAYFVLKTPELMWVIVAVGGILGLARLDDMRMSKKAKEAANAKDHETLP